MSRIVVLGAGICGLAAGILLRRDGHEVTVLERDAEAGPASVEDAWERWSREGVTQFRQPHILVPRGRIVLEEVLPDVTVALEAAGAARVDFLGLMPPSITDRTPRDGDDRFRTITARRPVLENALRRAAEAEPGLDMRPGVCVRELVVRTHDGTPHVRGVRVDSGDELHADLVVDAMGRRSPLPRWLAAAGCRPVHEQADDSGFIYYTRYFRARNGELPEFRAPIATPVGTFSLLTLPCDNDTWSVTIYIDAWACTNPSLGRGMSLGLRHVQCLRAVIREHLDDPRGFADAWDAVTEVELTPWYREIVEEDRARMAEIEALRQGLEPGPPSGAVVALLPALRLALTSDPDAFRAFIASRSCVTRLGEAFADQYFGERIRELARDIEPPPLPGPDRARLLALLDDA